MLTVFCLPVISRYIVLDELSSLSVNKQNMVIFYCTITGNIMVGASVEFIVLCAITYWMRSSRSRLVTEYVKKLWEEFKKCSTRDKAFITVSVTSPPKHFTCVSVGAWYCTFRWWPFILWVVWNGYFSLSSSPAHLKFCNAKFNSLHRSLATF